MVKRKGIYHEELEETEIKESKAKGEKGGGGGFKDGVSNSKVKPQAFVVLTFLVSVVWAIPIFMSSSSLKS